jgi:4-hydroxy-4-methyl-2-oxoglutarate aldolase
VAEIDTAVLAELAGIPTPAIANGLERFNTRPRDEGYMNGSVVCRFPGLGPMLGYAVTAKMTAGKDHREALDLRAELWEYTQAIPGPRVVVIEDLDDPPGLGSFWGEVNANVFRTLGCLGVITNGGVRDLPEMEALGFHAFSSTLAVSHAYNRIAEVGCPVTIAGLRIQPGDLLHADAHGVVNIPADVAPRLAGAVRDVEKAEQKTISLCRSPDFSVAKLLEMRRAVIH